MLGHRRRVDEDMLVEAVCAEGVALVFRFFIALQLAVYGSRERGLPRVSFSHCAGWGLGVIASVGEVQLVRGGAQDWWFEVSRELQSDGFGRD